MYKSASRHTPRGYNAGRSAVVDLAGPHPRARSARRRKSNQQRRRAIVNIDTEKGLRRALMDNPLPSRFSAEVHRVQSQKGFSLPEAVRFVLEMSYPEQYRLSLALIKYTDSSFGIAIKAAFTIHAAANSSRFSRTRRNVSVSCLRTASL